MKHIPSDRFQTKEISKYILPIKSIIELQYLKQCSLIDKMDQQNRESEIDSRV